MYDSYQATWKSRVRFIHFSCFSHDLSTELNMKKKKQSWPWFALLLNTVFANHYCKKNAWIYWDVIDSLDDRYSVKVNLTNGQGYTEISSTTVMTAFSKCANRKMLCAGDSLANFTCNHSPARHPERGGSGRGEIEFDCSDGLYTCYDFIWVAFNQGSP
ncbi:hypothetical protein L249_0315 [Ophiocordyceps polyrhachis-furcata BCC 54312]|uniref:Uncharacterized protein n=1 Tax=Ophiocordyceps polyrhachis-furcata BCC 54312 TaxID=1330021 RepID=A0A367LEG4_9HYPO|nr:hypothetical protein L249_0315 [Ophiocordyceps polyrhachis-furcata BCC 54312]